MKIKYKPTSAEVRKNRKEEYLSQYPIEIQLEAITEAAQGRPEKLNELLQGLAEIRESLPFSEEED
ncbi:MAG TPA: hypothetical protein PLL36_07165 [Candidatus Hydrogenedentes bacterium]|nr:hypothetical protein [Candidatus Hydrogenedentota bacterium]